ncbi:hypothetical protein [Flavobacterium pallidum]|uniref:Uncharacterized protein n=1 Tax=Flavobacterium pallidum TaxID=2172098 RepID=A0A2S1SIN7_9FLAO|nr:hypothetical protein [Flavobacterium pallidum]AWI26219.1 hypothetical protein HYN49_10080 [Flavobacterium pallidum]
MDGLRFIKLKIAVQEIIDHIGIRDYDYAREKLAAATDMLDDILDHSVTDEDVLEAGHYSALLEQLRKKSGMNN